MAAILELDEHLKREFTIFEAAPQVSFGKINSFRCKLTGNSIVKLYQNGFLSLSQSLPVITLIYSSVLGMESFEVKVYNKQLWNRSLIDMTSCQSDLKDTCYFILACAKWLSIIILKVLYYYFPLFLHAGGERNANYRQKASTRLLPLKSYALTSSYSTMTNIVYNFWQDSCLTLTFTLEL